MRTGNNTFDFLPLSAVFVLIFTLSLFLPQIVLAVDLSVYNVEGSVERERDGVRETPAAGESVQAGDILRTDEASTVSIVIPGASYLELAPGTELIAGEIAERTEQRGLFFFREEVEIRDLNFELRRGEINSTTQEAPEAELELDLMTPNAVLGVRGTTFDALSEPDEFTEAGVLEGEVEFINRAEPARRVTVGPRQQSRLGVDELQPSPPEEITPEREQKLSRHRERAVRGLRHPPVIDRSTIDGEPLEEEIQLNYNRPRTIELAGSARAGDAEVVGVRVKLDGTILVPDNYIVPSEVLDPGEPEFPRDVMGAEDPLFPGGDWQYEWTPELPEEGSSREHNITVQALGADGRVSREVSYRVELHHAEEDFPWPSGLQEGRVPLEVDYIASFPVEELEFPLHIYEGDLRNGEVEVEISGLDVPLQGLAYSTDGGSSWHVADRGGGLILRLPPSVLETGNLHLVGWTEETVGRSQVIGDLLDEVVYTPLRFEDLWRRLVTDFVRHMERREYRQLAEMLDEDFILEDHEEGTVDREEFLNDIIREEFRLFRGLRLRPNIQRLHGGREGAQVLFDFEMEYEVHSEDFMDSEEEFGGSIAFNSLEEIITDLRRHPDGQFRFVSIEPRAVDFRQLYWRRRREVYNSETFSIWPAWNREEAAGELTFGGGDTSVSIETNMDGGNLGIQALEDLNSWRDVGSIPRTGYENHVYWEYNPEEYDGGDFFAVRLQGSDFQGTAIFEIAAVEYEMLELKITTALGMSGDFDEPSFYFIHDFSNQEPR